MMRRVYEDLISDTGRANKADPEFGPARVGDTDVLERPVERILYGVVEAGSHTVALDAGDLPTGPYLLHFRTPAGTFTRSVVLVR